MEPHTLRFKVASDARPTRWQYDDLTAEHDDGKLRDAGI